MAKKKSWSQVADELTRDVEREQELEDEIFELKADNARLRAAIGELVEVDYWCHFDDKGRAIRVHDTSTVHMDGCTRMYVRAAAPHRHPRPRETET